MLYTLNLALLIGSLPLCLVIANPLPSSHSHPNSTILQETIVPWGPDEFKCGRTLHGDPVPQAATFMTALRAIAEEASEDFTGLLKQQHMTFSYPPLHAPVAIGVSSDTDQPLPRRFLLWGTARVLNHMSVLDAFRASVYQLSWRGKVVGSIVVAAGGNGHLVAGAGDAPTSMSNATRPSPELVASSPASSILDTANSVNFDFESYGRQLTMIEIFMATIGSMIQLAQHSGTASLEYWRGNFPGYRVYHIWEAQRLPSLMSKRLLIVSMESAVTYASEHINWHELRVVLNSEGGEIVRGGWMYGLSNPMAGFGSS